MILIADAILIVIFFLEMWLTSNRLTLLEQWQEEAEERLSKLEYYQAAMRYEVSYLLEQAELNTRGEDKR